MPSPTTMQGLLGLFTRGADPPANEPRATIPPVQSPTSLSLQAILAAGAGGRSARGGARGHRVPREVGRSGEGGKAKSKGWSRGSDDASDVEMEEEGWEDATLTASPWGAQERRARGLRVDAQAGSINSKKAPSTTDNQAGTRVRHGAHKV